MNRKKPYVLPELSDGEKWTTHPSDDLRAMTDVHDHIMIAPVEDGWLPGGVRLHELAHAKWTPRTSLDKDANKFGHSDDQTMELLIQSCEDRRIHSLLAETISDWDRTYGQAMREYAKSTNGGVAKMTPLMKVAMEICIRQKEGEPINILPKRLREISDEAESIILADNRNPRVTWEAARYIRDALTDEGNDQEDRQDGQGSEGGNDSLAGGSNGGEGKPAQQQATDTSARPARKPIVLTEEQIERMKERMNFIPNDAIIVPPPKIGTGGSAGAPSTEEDGFTSESETRWCSCGDPSCNINDGKGGLRSQSASRGATRTPATAWCEMEIVKPPLTVPMPRHRVIGRGRKMRTEGSVPRHPQRLYTGGPIFSRKARGNQVGGTVLIDCSGSMAVSDKDLEEMLKEIHGGIIATYSSDPTVGRLKIVAKGYRRVSRPTSFGRGNGVDGPALQWLAKLPGPRAWICDGYTSGIGDDPYGRDECTKLEKRYNIKRYNNIAEYLAGKSQLPGTYRWDAQQ